MPKTLLFLLILFFSGVLFAADLRFSHLGIQQGGIDVLTQDNHGFLWIGTRNGLLRYDGNTIKTYRHAPDKPETLQEDAIIALHYGKDGRLWIGTAGNGASYYNYATGNFTRLDTSVIGKHVYRFYDDNQGQGVYAQTTAGLFFIDRSDKVKHVLGAKYSESVLGLYTEETGTYAILETGQKLVLGQHPDRPEVYRFIPKTLIQYWQTNFCPHLIRESTSVGGGSGLFYCLKGNQVNDASLNQALFMAGINPALLQVYDLTEDDNGVIWISSDQGLLRIAGNLVTAVNSPGFDGKSLSSNQLSVLLAGQKNTLFIGTQDQGLNILHPDDSGITYFNNLQATVSSRNTTTSNKTGASCQPDETEQAVWRTLKDTDGDLWVGNSTGLAYRPAGGNAFQVQNQLGGNDEATDVCTVRALAEAGNNIWIGTQSGLIAYDKHSQTVERFLSQQNSKETQRDGGHKPFTGNSIRALLHDRKRNSLWVGTEQAGLKRIALNSGKIQRFPYAANNPQMLPHAQVDSLYLDRNNRLWVGTGAGLSLWQEDSNTFKSILASNDSASLSDATVHAIYQSDQDKLWLGTGNGLNLFSISQFRVEKRWFERDGLPSPVVYSVVPDNLGHYWLSTGNGISRFDPETDSFNNKYPQHETQAGTFTVNSWYQEKPGLIYLGTVGGLSVVNPEVFGGDDKSHSPIITRIDDLDKSMRPDKTEDRIDTPLALVQMVSAVGENVMQQLVRNIRINFSFPFFGDTDLLQSEYRLLPAIEDWAETRSGAQYVEYINLKPGEYEFQLRANLAAKATSFRFTIKPYFWETTWFRTLTFIVLLILTVFLTIYCYRAWGKFSAERLTRQHYRIVEHELRPHLHEANKQLTSLLQSPRLTIKDKQVIRFSVMPLIAKSIDFIAELRALVDLRRTVKQPKQLYMLEDVLDEVLLFFRDHQQRISINEVEDINILTHQDAVYLLVKNLISNAVKYSPGGEPVYVNVRVEGKALIIECVDQGIGISKDKRQAIYEPYKRFAGEYKNINGQGIGLAIVRFIVHTYQGSISIADNQPKGSRFTVRLKGVVADE